VREEGAARDKVAEIMVLLKANIDRALFLYYII
jgi:hypothetical protein